jgi:CBS domain-containing protein
MTVSAAVRLRAMKKVNGHAALSASWVKAARRMVEKDVRHLVVVDDDGRVVGVVSMRDLFGRLTEALDTPRSSNARFRTVLDRQRAARRSPSASAASASR